MAGFKIFEFAFLREMSSFSCFLFRLVDVAFWVCTCNFDFNIVLLQIGKIAFSYGKLIDEFSVGLTR